MTVGHNAPRRGDRRVTATVEQLMAEPSFRSIKWDVVSDARAIYFAAREVTVGKAAITRLEQDASVMQAGAVPTVR
jgi:hypothetical protein